jgi:hypothetical protein
MLQAGGMSDTIAVPGAASLSQMPDDVSFDPERPRD